MLRVFKKKLKLKIKLNSFVTLPTWIFGQMLTFYDAQKFTSFGRIHKLENSFIYFYLSLVKWEIGGGLYGPSVYANVVEKGTLLMLETWSAFESVSRF